MQSFVIQSGHFPFSELMDVFQLGKKILKIFRKFSGDFQVTSVPGVLEPDHPRVQALTGQAGHRLFRPIHLIPRHGMAQGRHVNANLVRATGFQTKLHMCKARVPGNHMIMRDGVFGILLRDRHLLPVHGMPPDRRIHRAVILFQVPVDNGLVNPGETVLFNLLSKLLVGKIILCHNQQTAGIFVDAVKNTGTHHPSGQAKH